jgi:hypothetical protein
MKNACIYTLNRSSSVSLTTSRFRRRRRHQTAASELRHPQMISTPVRGMSGWGSPMELHERNAELCPPRKAFAVAGAKQATAARDSSETLKCKGEVGSYRGPPHISKGFEAILRTALSPPPILRLLIVGSSCSRGRAIEVSSFRPDFGEGRPHKH